ncbi:twin-arginine translocase TatA/TatE family subunit [Vulgatibacter sp.]|uniref:twin-arginine translocase TatA/TatE family subunit n=1 Tax=Vulgatibacter sp. TaxID=1971226 RepID=UPI003565336F
MFGLSFGEILIILVVALMVLGPSGMPKLARTLGKGLRDFRRATGDIRGSFEQEFYKLDQEVENATRVDGPKAAAAAGIEPGSVSTANAPPEGVAPRNAALLPPEGTEPTVPQANLAVAPTAEAPAATTPAAEPAAPPVKATEETR